MSAMEVSIKRKELSGAQLASGTNNRTNMNAIIFARIILIFSKRIKSTVQYEVSLKIKTAPELTHESGSFFIDRKSVREMFPESASVRPRDSPWSAQQEPDQNPPSSKKDCAFLDQNPSSWRQTQL